MTKRWRRKAQEAEYYSRVLKALGWSREGDTAKGLRATTGLNSENFGKAVLTALEDGRQKKCRVKKHTRMEDGYKPTGK